MERITAEEARELSRNAGQERVNDAVDKAYVLIRQAAANKLRKVALYSQFWVHEGHKESMAWMLAKQKLEADGFVVWYDHGSGSLHTVVKW